MGNTPSSTATEPPPPAAACDSPVEKIMEYPPTLLELPADALRTVCSNLSLPALSSLGCTLRSGSGTA